MAALNAGVQVRIVVGVDLNAVVDRCAQARTVVAVGLNAVADRVAQVRLVAAAHNLEGLRGDSVTLICAAPAFQFSRAFGVDLPVDQQALHYGAAACALGDRFSAQLVRADPSCRSD